MTTYLNFRSRSVGGAVVDPVVYQGNGSEKPLALQRVEFPAVESMVTEKNVLIGVHGFNVSLESGAQSLGQLEPYLSLTSSDIFFGALWPGDFWLPVINYPFEGAVSMDCGRRLATFCRFWLSKAQSISFVSHSLGARMVLEAVKNLDRPARVVCLTAAAINKDCLDTEYAKASANSQAISILASRADWVLRLAFSIGDPIADLLHDDHTPFQPALGYGGPPVPALPPIRSPWQISDAECFRHNNYLPHGDDAKWEKAAGFMGRAFRNETQNWP
jgi:hypothetical protein